MKIGTTSEVLGFNINAEIVKDLKDQGELFKNYLLVSYNESASATSKSDSNQKLGQNIK